jgi:HJR/Mrr/RecB family endonuclease
MRSDTAAEWQAELASVLHDTEGLPLTRLLRGVLYAAGMFRAAVLITHEMSDEETSVSPLIAEPNFQELTGIEFEHLVVTALQQIGFDTVSQLGVRNDGGIDIIALNNAPIVGGRLVVSAKRYSPERKVGTAAVMELLGSMSYHGFGRGIIITTSRFTSAAREAAERFGIELLDGERFLWLLRQYRHREFTITGRTHRKPSTIKRSLLRTLFRLCSGRR